MRVNAHVDEYISGLDGNKKVLALMLRELILDAHPDIREEWKWSTPCYSCNGLLCYFKAFRTHLNFGFYKGHLLTDPDKLLVGETNPKLRHVKITSPVDIKPGIFINWINQAIDSNERSPV